ncbi:MAG: hypothetical protein OMM_06077 [Candidatus Magnetoglobus multicellularis str. Araruama]|uniref:Malate/L-lactate dehydrogenase n=1 Tax=Candidatus Magnetoglobus multicellularis str. Araruama TaxID=890399 RepID=A0A1V1NRZ7_9BACT|nr:MAG: hypothetical protein OMM_06077 [Candidatus Magnetoglobus multicellularis str. Araruama]
MTLYCHLLRKQDQLSAKLLFPQLSLRLLIIVLQIIIGEKYMRRFDSNLLKSAMKNVLKNNAVNEDSIYHVTESLIQTSLRGVDSHGINLFPHYINAIKSGRINKEPNLTITETAPSTVIVNADNAFGHHAGAIAMNYAIKMAKKTGLVAVSVRNSTHFGAAAYFALKSSGKKIALDFHLLMPMHLLKHLDQKNLFLEQIQFVLRLL